MAGALCSPGGDSRAAAVGVAGTAVRSGAAVREGPHRPQRVTPGRSRRRRGGVGWVVGDAVAAGTVARWRRRPRAACLCDGAAVGTLRIQRLRAPKPGEWVAPGRYAGVPGKILPVWLRDLP